MRREEFGDWGKELSERDFWCAVAAFGCANAVRASGDEKELVGEPLASADHLPWLWEFDGSELAAVLQGMPPPADWVRLWEKIRRPLAIRTCFDNQEDLVSAFTEYAATSVYLDLGFDSPSLDWRWPVRFGFLLDEKSKRIQDRFEDHQRTVEWMATLTTAEPVTFASDFDFLVIPGGLGRESSVLDDSPNAVHANCLIVFQEEPLDFVWALSRCVDMMRLTGASGLALVPVLPGSEGALLQNVVFSLSHNEHLDLAFHQAGFLSEGRTVVLLAGQELMNESRISTEARRTVKQLHRKSKTPVKLPAQMARDLGLEPRWYLAPEVGNALGHALNEGPGMLETLFQGESHGASHIVNLARAINPRKSFAKPDTGSRVEAPRPPDPTRRYLQAELRHKNLAGEWELVNRLIPDASLTIFVSIALPLGDSIVASEAFPDEKLPPDEKGHLLTIVFSEPHLLHDPLTRSLYLPRTGSSDIAIFPLSLSETTKQVEGRFIVLYRNRILQTAVFRGYAGERPELTVEMVVRPGIHGLSRLRQGNYTLLLNHTSDGVPRATTGAGYKFATFSIQGIEPAITQIEAEVNGTSWASAEFATLEADGTGELLRYLARKGSAMFAEFYRYSPNPERLKNASFVQVVSREDGARLPIEFFYDRKAPKPGAKLCTGARQALEDRKCPESCADDGASVCPLGFWCFSKVIEWHKFRDGAKNDTDGRAYALRDVRPEERPESLPDFESVLLAASAKVDNVVKDSVENVRQELRKRFGSHMAEAATWKEWTEKIQELSPSVLLLLPHTEEDEDQVPSMEINNDFLSSINIEDAHVIGPRGKPNPIVLLLGCNTDNAGLAFERFVPFFTDKQAAVVVTSISKVLGRHAAPLAQRFIEFLATVPRRGHSSFGEVMLEVRRRAVLDGLIVAIVLKAYGDADWRI